MIATATRLVLSARWGSESVIVRNVKTTTSYYVPDANGWYVLASRPESRKHPRAVKIVTVTTRAKEETPMGRLYRIDCTFSARDCSTLVAFREQQVFVNAVELWRVDGSSFTTINYV